MRAEGIETAIGTYAIHHQPFYARSFGYRPGSLPASSHAFKHSLALPMYPSMEEPTVRRWWRGSRSVWPGSDQEGRPMEIIRVDGADERWDEFVWDSPAGTIFSSRRFLSYHPASRFDWLDLAVEGRRRPGVRVAGGRVAAATGRQVVQVPGRRLLRRLRASGTAATSSTVSEAVDLVTAELRGHGFRRRSPGLPPACYSGQPRTGVSSLRSARRATGWSSGMRQRSSTWSASETTILIPALRRNLRKAEKAGVRVRATDDRRTPSTACCAANLAEKGARAHPQPRRARGCCFASSRTG